MSNQPDSLAMPPKGVFETSYAAVLKYFVIIIVQVGKEKQWVNLLRKTLKLATIK